MTWYLEAGTYFCATKIPRNRALGIARSLQGGGGDLWQVDIHALDARVIRTFLIAIFDGFLRDAAFEWKKKLVVSLR